MAGSVGNIETDIIKSGLVFNMDAANRACYPKTGTTVIDTIGNTSGTLNGTTFSNINSGIFSFDGTDDYINLNSFSSELKTYTNVSICFIAKTSATPSQEYNNIVFGSNKTNGNAFRIGMGYNGGLFFSSNNTSGTSGDHNFQSNNSSLTKTLNNGSFYYICLVQNSDNYEAYVDGSSIGSYTAEINDWSRCDLVQIGMEYDGASTSDHFNGQIANMQIYNRALSSTEVLHNYNALKSRFGL